MDQLDITVQSLFVYIGIFLLMLGSFLIGYFGTRSSVSRKAKKQIKKLKKQIDTLKTESKYKNIETIFTEIKPKIVEVVKETQSKMADISPSQNIAERTSTQYVRYTKNKRILNFEKIGTANKKERDDLTKIDGIGPYIEEKLNEIGIFTYNQISKLQDSDIRTITELIEFFPGRIERDNWVGQANAIKVY